MERMHLLLKSDACGFISVKFAITTDAAPMLFAKACSSGFRHTVVSTFYRAFLKNRFQVLLFTCRKELSCQWMILYGLFFPARVNPTACMYSVVITTCGAVFQTALRKD